MLDVNRLFLLHQLSLLGTISRVAKSQGLTRPAVSQQLLKLEQEVGLVLFERSGRGVQLTPAGKQLVERSHELFTLLESMEAEVEASSRRVSGQVRIGAFGSAVFGLLPLTLQRLHQEHPGIDIDVHEMESPDGLRAAAAKQVDLALVDDLMDRAALIGSLQMLPLCVDEFLAVLPAQHPLAHNAQLKLADLAQERWDLNHASLGYNLLLLNQCRAQGFEPKVRSNCRNLGATLELIKAGRLVSVLPAMNLRAACVDVHLKVVRLVPPITRQIFIATVRESSRRPVIAAVIAALRETAGHHS
ncbi:LysR family transcriptional regulator [Hydrogenophaga sp. BPS33]|uniref:LysR family transcriptional regulator n=1 Tax=Hydrogenophaga sp. BPS33 TaxID=2651974 RepID=UPI0013592391|nr:LysR family transcriptional regulator [Hydrogenophaga sp. BPS33]